MSNIIVPNFGAQKDGSMIDIHGNTLTKDEVFNIIGQVASLPVTAMKDDITHAIHNHEIIIAVGETGSGKTTQIPKMCMSAGKQIIVTQPRVLSAMSNADRVSKELLAETRDPSYSLGHKVGYRTGRGVSSSRISPLSFNTDGLELMRMAYSGLIPDILVLDEVHNFAIPTEMIAMLLKYKKNIKIIIMSATLDPVIFQDYFSHISSDIPVIRIPGRTHPVEKIFLGVDNYIDTITTQYNLGKNILFFVPGKREIEDNIGLLRAKLGFDAEIFPLHSELPKEQQQQLLTKATDKPRIIVCTNVAEESITIPYIDVVVDLGTHKVARYNNLGIQELRLENTAQANCLQRAGRAGRTKPGEYFRANDTAFEDLNEYPEAPMEREMLDKYILILLANGIDIEAMNEEEILNDGQLFFHEFNSKLLRISYKRLMQIGAIDFAKKITPLGRDLLKFPLEVYHARMLREAIKRKCTEDMIYMTAILEKKGFVSKEEEWKEIKLPGAKDSDLFAYTELFKLLTANTLPKGKISILLGLGVNEDELNDFIDRDGEYKLYELVDLSPIGVKNKKIKEIDELVLSLRKKLTDSGIEITSSTSMSDKKICLATGSLHHIYKYDAKMKLFQNRESKTGKNTIFFKAGKVTTIEPSVHHYYLGQPFIIGGGEFSQDLNLLTFLTEVDEGHIHDAKSSTQLLISHSHAKVSKNKSTQIGGEKGGQTSEGISAHMEVKMVEMSKEKIVGSTSGVYEEVLKGDNTKIDHEEIIREVAQFLESSKSESHNNFFQTQEDPQMYYLKYRLPDFLVEHNQRIAKYLNNKSDDEVFAFKELLVRFLLEDEAYRVNVTNKASIAKTEKSFRHDTIILDRFLESTDPFIVAFRRGEKINLPTKDVELITGTAIEEDFIKNAEIFELQKQYTKLLGSLGTKTRRVNVDRLKITYLNELLQHFHLGLDADEYKAISLVYKEMKEMEMTEVKKRVARLKGVERGVKALKKLQHKKKGVEDTIEIMRSLINGARGINIQTLFGYKFSEDFSDKYIDKYFNALRLIQSVDNKQRKRGIAHLSSVILDLNTQILKINQEITLLENETNLTQVIQAQIVQANLESLCRKFFDGDYYKNMVAEKILNITREILRDQITENKGLDKILLQFLFSFKFLHSIEGERRRVFELVDKYTDTIDVLDVYKSDIYREIKDSMDVEKIQSRIEELRLKIEEFRLHKQILAESNVSFL